MLNTELHLSGIYINFYIKKIHVLLKITIVNARGIYAVCYYAYHYALIFYKT